MATLCDYGIPEWHPGMTPGELAVDSMRQLDDYWKPLRALPWLGVTESVIRESPRSHPVVDKMFKKRHFAQIDHLHDFGWLKLNFLFYWASPLSRRHNGWNHIPATYGRIVNASDNIHLTTIDIDLVLVHLRYRESNQWVYLLGCSRS